MRRLAAPSARAGIATGPPAPAPRWRAGAGPGAARRAARATARRTHPGRPGCRRSIRRSAPNRSSEPPPIGHPRARPAGSRSAARASGSAPPPASRRPRVGCTRRRTTRRRRHRSRRRARLRIGGPQRAGTRGRAVQGPPGSGRMPSAGGSSARFHGRGVVAPLGQWRQLAAHEQQLLARLGELVAQQAAQVGEALPSSPGILPSSDPCRAPPRRATAAARSIGVHVQAAEGEPGCGGSADGSGPRGSRPACRASSHVPFEPKPRPPR